MPRSYTAVTVEDTSTCFEYNYCRSRALAEIIVCDVSYDTIAFSFEIACDAELKREFGAVNNEDLFRPQMRACFSTVGTSTEKAP